MNADILRSEECTAPTAPPGAFVWCAWLCLTNPPLAFGRDPAEAEARLREMLIELFREENQHHADPEARTAEELLRQKRGGLLWVVAPDEERAFLVWQQQSALVVSEALKVWRTVFPLAKGETDPLEKLGRMPKASATRTRYVFGLVQRDQRGLSRRRTLIGQLVEHLPHLETWKIENLCRMAEAL